MFGLNVIYQMKEGKREDFLRALEESGLPTAVRAETGCVQYEYFRAVVDDNKLLLLEKWDSRQAQAVHLKQPHMAAMGPLRDAFIENSVLEPYDI